MTVQPKGSGMIMAAAIVAIIIAVVALTLPYALPPGKAEAGSSKASPQMREFYFVTPELGFNETEIGIPHYVFTPSHLTVNQGDTVLIHFYNTADDTHHTFTLSAYNINVDLAPGAKQDIRFTATQAGVFQFLCTFHPTTMRGELVVLSG